MPVSPPASIRCKRAHTPEKSPAPTASGRRTTAAPNLVTGARLVRDGIAEQRHHRENLARHTILGHRLVIRLREGFGKRLLGDLDIFAKLLGEPTGNAPSSYGDILTFTLPASGLSYTLSFKRWRRPDGARDPAPTLLPDVPLPRTAATVREGTDPVLDWLRAQ